MKTIQGQIFRELEDRSGKITIVDMEFRRCAFRHCRISTQEIEKRPHIRNVTLVNCEEFNSHLSEAVVEEVTVDGFKTNDLFILSDCAFLHVVFRGNCGQVKITSNFARLVRQLPELQVGLDEANAAYYNNVDWALDISQAEFTAFNVSGMPLSLIRRDKETQVILPAAVTLGGAWRDVLEFSETWGPQIDALLKVGHSPEMLLVAPKRHRDFSKKLSALNALRRTGVIP